MNLSTTCYNGRYCSPFTAWFDTVVKNNSGQFTLCKNRYKLSSSWNTMYAHIEDVSGAHSSDCPTLDSTPFSYATVTWFNIIVTIDNTQSIVYISISAVPGTTEAIALVAVSMILIKLENSKCSSLLVILRLVIVILVNGLFLVHELHIYNGGCGMWGICIVVDSRNGRICLFYCRYYIDKDRDYLRWDATAFYSCWLLTTTSLCL